jgi:hypothetical protein
MINELKPHHGALKILSNGDTSKPTYETDGESDYQIMYTNPILDDQAYYPINSPTRSVADLYAPSVTVDETEYTGVWLENKVLGVTNTFRISITYSGKVLLNNEGIYLSIVNPISGFTKRHLMVLPGGETGNNNISTLFNTYADENSLASPLGTGTGGYQLFISTTFAGLTLTIEDIARLNASS